MPSVSTASSVSEVFDRQRDAAAADQIVRAATAEKNDGT
jgi:hypothetical protein